MGCTQNQTKHFSCYFDAMKWNENRKNKSNNNSESIKAAEKW